MTQSYIRDNLLLNPHSGYVIIDAYLLKLLCHMTCDVKVFYMLFFLIYIAFQKLHSTSLGARDGFTQPNFLQKV